MSAVRLLTGAPFLQAAYSRVPLLLSLSQPKDLPPRLKVVLAEDIFHRNVATTDGASDVGWRMAATLGLLNNLFSGRLYVVCCRAVPWLFFVGTHASHLGQRHADGGPSQRRSSRKVDKFYSRAVSADQLDLDISATTADPHRAGRINSQVTRLSMRNVCTTTA